MKESDISEGVRIIMEHDQFDGVCAQHYFRAYFGDPSRVKSSKEENYVIVRESSGSILGVSGFTPDKYATPEIYWLNWTYVDEKYRNQGLGTALLSFVIEQVKHIGARKLYLDTSSDESYEAAIRLYKRFGFEQEGLLKNYYDDGDHYIILGKQF